MNQKTAKALRKLVGFKPNEEREYIAATIYDQNGESMESALGKKATGKRADYQLLKKYFNGESVNLPAYLKALL